MFSALKKLFKSDKINFGLALGGGAARGLAHIGVLRYLEENNLVPSEIAGTSMGAIIGSAVAFGKTSKELENIIKEIKFINLLDFDLKTGVVHGKKIMNFFQEVFDEVNIEDAKIPLKIVAVDIDTGEKIVFEKGRLIDAIRSSISIPGILAPYKFEGKSLVDGGIISNLPVEVLDSNNVIAVSVVRDPKRKIETKNNFLGFDFNKTFFGITFQILQKSLDLMMSQNEKTSLGSKKNIILVHPKFSEIDYYEFSKFDEIINIGYEEAKEILALEKLNKKFG